MLGFEDEIIFSIFKQFAFSLQFNGKIKYENIYTRSHFRQKVRDSDLNYLNLII